MVTVRTYLLFSLIMAFLGGCTSQQIPQGVLPILPANALAGEFLAQKKADISRVMEAAEKRNREIEKKPEWIAGAYRGLGIRKLNDILPPQYQEYRKYVDDGAVYIFVHPAYYLFFHARKPQILRSADDFTNSVVDIFLSESYDDTVTRLEQEQQKNEKNFIEYLTTEGKLVILVLPRDYRRSSNYGYADSPDEYARYLNEIANSAPSILYMESETAGSGKLLPGDLIPLLSLLEATEATSVLIGGGYVGRCQKEFYTYITNFAISGTYSIVPELSTFSPEDVSEKMASQFLENLQINLQSSAEYVLLKTPGNVTVQHLPAYYRDSIFQVSEGDPLTDLHPQAGGGRNGSTLSSTPSLKPSPDIPVNRIAPAEDTRNYCY